MDDRAADPARHVPPPEVPEQASPGAGEAPEGGPAETPAERAGRDARWLDAAAGAGRSGVAAGARSRPSLSGLAAGASAR